MPSSSSISSIGRLFWGNIDVFKCCQAAQALAKRGTNVTRVFIGISRGGVGQSLYSLHPKAMFAHNFAFFEPNVWFNEDEMRKQVEQLNGCCVLTGQETPATGRKLREDLLKKFASADGIAGRKPYGFLTRMIHFTSCGSCWLTIATCFRGSKLEAKVLGCNRGVRVLGRRWGTY